MAHEQWLALNIGNSRCHAGIFHTDRLQKVLEVAHSDQQILDQQLADWGTFARVLIASVVPSLQTSWHNHSSCHCLTLTDIPLHNCYTSLGIDRALAAWGAGLIYGFPVLTIDGGTAISLTGVDEKQQLVGGAILPGLQMLARSLHQFTDQLPLVPLPDGKPNRWAQDTIGSLQSGILYTVLASLEGFMQSWQQLYPGSPVILTGGNGQYLSQFLPLCQFNPYLIFSGMQQVYLATR